MASESSTSLGNEQAPRSNSLQNPPQDWTPGLGPIMDDQSQQNSRVMQHDNRSVPYLPSERPPPEYQENIEPVPPVPQFDPTHALDQFSALRLHDPIQRGGSALSYTSDPVPRTGSSMSVRSAQSHTRMNGAGRLNTLPPAPNHLRPRPIMEVEDARYANDGASLYSRNSGGSRGEYDQQSMYSFDGTGANQSFDGTRPVQGYPHQGWADSQGGYNAHHMYQQPPPGSYNGGLYAAASDVLGMGPQAGGPVLPNGQEPYGYPQAPPAHLAYYQPQQYSGSYPQDGSYAHHSSETSPAPSLAPPSSIYTDDSGDPELRPSLHRSGTTASVTLRTQKSKAVDLSAPPYTKEFIDQYRQRIKADPDPEAHFLYAKYLIDAAKKVGKDAKDQRAVRKYRDLLVTESLKVVRRLATSGTPYDEAQFFLANCYGTGTLGLQVDHERAYHLYLQAAKQNHAAASYRVAVCNEIGAGTRKDAARAAAFYKKAASLGDTAAMYKLGMILLHGSLEERPKPADAVGWLRRASEQADAENPHALHELGLLYEQPNSQLVQYNPAQAKELFTHAAQLGYTPSQYKLGQCYEYGHLTCPVDPRRSIAWYTKAAEKGDPEAELALSGWYLTGSEGVLKQSDSEAYLWARRAANKGLSKAEYAVGYYAEVGIGIKQDIEFAKRWYMRAAAQGNKRAMNRLTEMKRMGNKKFNVNRPTRQQAKDECVIC